MPQWVRPLDQSTKAAAEWHVPRIKSFTTTAYCGKIVSGSIEVTTDDNAARGARCQQCLVSLGPMPEKTIPPGKKTTAKSAAAEKTTRTRRV